MRHHILFYLNSWPQCVCARVGFIFVLSHDLNGLIVQPNSGSCMHCALCNSSSQSDHNIYIVCVTCILQIELYCFSKPLMHTYTAEEAEDGSRGPNILFIDLYAP